MYDALDVIDICVVDISNYYLQYPSPKKYCIIFGPKFDLEIVGKKELIRRTLCGGKDVGYVFQNHLCACMRNLGLSYLLEDPDVWMQLENKSDGLDYYKYVLVYTDDILEVSNIREKLLRYGIGDCFD